jgi:glycine dehydrogenase
MNDLERHPPSGEPAGGTGSGERDFARRHIGPDPHDLAAMLQVIGVGSVDELMRQTLPETIRLTRPLALPEGLSEQQALEQLRALAANNHVATSLIGTGYYGTILPEVIRRNVLENPAWYSAYTPYQPEISQGRLEALLTFQTLVCELTALEVANASLLDEATAAAEAMGLARRLSRSGSTSFLVDAAAHPQTLAVLRTHAEALGWRLIRGTGPQDVGADGCFGALLQYPGTFGEVRDLRIAIDGLHAQGALVALAADPLALTLLVPPGELGADVAIGSMQRFGLPMGYGGPHAAYIAVRDEYKRELPGRLVGVSIDAHGATAYRLALQTREQHIRREKATSNICTAQVLPAVMASMYAVYHGPDGLAHIARRIQRHAGVLAAGLRRLGYRILNDTFFDTLTVAVADEQPQIVRRSLEQNLNLRIIPPGQCAPAAAVGMSVDEITTTSTVEAIWRAFGGTWRYEQIESTAAAGIPPLLQRRSAYLRQPVFHLYRSETELLRYLRRLSDRDLALDRSMIPLGSCTMKLNAAAELTPIAWSQFNALHPYAPVQQAAGYTALCAGLERALCEITGYDAVSLQPNSGAQGEYAGLLAVRAYHRSRQQAQRDVCLIPASAHGTNPASARLAGLRVVVVDCDRHGNVDLDALRAKARAHADTLAAAMVTYPSTHGVFEDHIVELCEIVHRAGGQVYLDGANLNALVGLARPGDFGADVSHLNLHKTFCIPHGGGGPGMGPIAVKHHLAPFLPGHPLGGTPAAAGPVAAVGPVSAAPFGSASILPISYMYLLLMGAHGLRHASEMAIVAANYVARRLEPHYPVLYRNARGRVAHECIIDPRAYQRACGVTVDDIAKRLIDFGFHPPTVSFPVTGTLMIEPTESESRRELDRFCEAMIAIRQEIDDLIAQRHALADSPLRHAPHTARDLAADQWTRPYPRAAGCFPAGDTGADKYWPPVGRIDHVYGDRHPVCCWPPVAEFEPEAKYDEQPGPGCPH